MTSGYNSENGYKSESPLKKVIGSKKKNSSASGTVHDFAEPHSVIIHITSL